MKTNLKNNIFRILTTVVLLSLGTWSFYYNWQQRSIRFGNFTYSNEEAERLKNYPKAMYAHGLKAWARQDPETAERFFRQAVSKDVLFLDGWIRLAEAEAEMGQKENAKNILTFTIDLTKHVSRWKWPQMLLARELDMDEIIYSNANYLLSHERSGTGHVAVPAHLLGWQRFGRYSHLGPESSGCLSRMAYELVYDRRKPEGVECNG